MRCFVTMVTQQKTASQWTLTFWLHNHVTKTCYTEQTILNLNCIYQTSILRPLPAKLDDFYLLDPCRAKNLTSDLFFRNYETVRCRNVKLYFFWIVITKGICWYGIWQHWSNFWIWPCTNYLVTPRLPVQDVTRQQYEWWSLHPYQHNEIIKPFVSFQLSKLS